MSDSKRSNGTALNAYLKEIGKTPLLTKKQETALFRRLDMLRKARRQAEKQGLPSAVVQRIEVEEKRARDEIVRRNLRLAASISKKYRNRGVETLDLIQEGSMGILRAIESFDWRRGVPFSSYAAMWIQQRMGLAVANQARTVRVPTYLQEWRRQIRRHQSSGEESIEALSSASGLTPDQVKRALGADSETVSLDAAAGDCGRPLYETIEDESRRRPDALAEAKMKREEIESALSELDPRTARVVRLRYGLDDGGARSLREVGIEVGLSRERVRQLEASAFDSIRQRPHASRLRQYL